MHLLREAERRVQEKQDGVCRNGISGSAPRRSSHWGCLGALGFSPTGLLAFTRNAVERRGALLAELSAREDGRAAPQVRSSD